MTNFLGKKQVRLLLPSQEAVPGQSINVALGQFGVNIPQFIKDFNDKSSFFPKGMILCVNSFVSFDGSFDLEIKGPSVLYLIKCLFNQSNEFHKKDILILLFIIRFYRKDLFFMKDLSLVKCILGVIKSRDQIFNAFKK